MRPNVAQKYGITEEELIDIYLKVEVYNNQEIPKTIALEKIKDEPTPKYIAEEEEIKNPIPNYICSSNYYNCGDFTGHTEAKTVFDYCKSLGKGDIHRLDADNDEKPCEWLS